MSGNLLSLDRHEVLDAIRHSNSLREAYLKIAKLRAVGEYDDTVLVVRCKDCRHRDPEDHKCDSGENERNGCPFPVADGYFCAYGER